MYFYSHRLRGMFQLQSWRLVVGDEVAGVAFGARASTVYTTRFLASSRKRRCVQTNNRPFGLGRQVRRSLTSISSLSWPLPPSTTSWATGLPTVPSGAMDIACRAGHLLRSCCYLLAVVEGRGVLLFSCCLVLCPLAPCPTFRFLSFFIASLSFVVLSLSLSKYRNSFGTALSYRCRTITPKRSVRYATQSITGVTLT